MGGSAGTAPTAPQALLVRVGQGARPLVPGRKEGCEEDRQVRATIPPDQGAEFNRYIELMNAANEGLGIYLVVMRANVEQLGLISGWLATIRSIHSFELGLFIFRSVPKPITPTDYERLREPRGDGTRGRTVD